MFAKNEVFYLYFKACIFLKFYNYIMIKIGCHVYLSWRLSLLFNFQISKQFCDILLATTLFSMTFIFAFYTLMGLKFYGVKFCVCVFLDVFWRWIIIALGEYRSVFKQVSVPYSLINWIIYLFKSSYKSCLSWPRRYFQI